MPEEEEARVGVDEDHPGWMAKKIFPDVAVSGCIGSGWDLFPHPTQVSGWEVRDTR